MGEVEGVEVGVGGEGAGPRGGWGKSRSCLGISPNSHETSRALEEEEEEGCGV